MEDGMGCLVCGNLERAFEARWREYIEASSGAYFTVSSKFAAYLNVEMERARTELQEHRLVCLSAANISASLPAVALRQLPQKERVRGNPVESAA